MSSIISYKLKKSLAESFYADVLSRRARYYCFFGSPQQNTLSNTLEYEKIARQGIVSAKRIFASDVSYIVPRFNWTSGTVYAQFNRLMTGIVDASGPKFYVLTDSNNTYNVYKCINNGNNQASTIIPTGTDSDPVTYSDGYTWQFMYNIPKIMRTKFLTGDYIPVFSSLQTRFFQNGSLENCTVIQNGSGYTQSGVYITIDGDGVGAELHPVVQSGKITDVIIVSAGEGYTYAKATVVVKSGFGGTGAKLSIDLQNGDIETDQTIVELLSIPGTIDQIDVTNQGDGYITAAVNIEGDGEGAAAQAVISSGKIQRILITNRGRGYNWAKISIVGQISPQAPTVTSTAVANISPQHGHGRSSVEDLFATKLSLFTNIYSDRLSDHDVGSLEYTQYGIAKDFRNFEYSTFVYDQVTSKQYVAKSKFGPYISVSGGSGFDAQIVPTITGDYVESIKIEDAGDNYATAPTISFSGLPGGSEAPSATATILGDLTDVTVNYPGVGLPVQPYLYTSSGQARLEASITTGVVAVSLNNQGTGYTSAPAVSFTGGGGTGAAATALISNGKIVKIIVTNPGKDYVSSPTVSFAGGGGSGQIATAIMSNTVIKQVQIEQSTRSFQSAPTVQTGQSTGINDFIISDSGTGFSTVTAVTFSGGGGQGLTGVPVVADCVRTITITNQGSGYTSTPTVTISGVGSGATATATATNGRVTSINITHRGWGYTSAPTITISGGGATVSATAVATVSYGLQMIQITNPGSGYTSAPRLSFNGSGYSGLVVTPVYAKPTFTTQISGQLQSVRLTYPGKNVGNNLGVVISGSGSLYPVVKGTLTGVEVVHGGAGYTSKPTATLISDSGAAAQINLLFDATTKKVLSAVIENAGQGYPITTFSQYGVGDTLVDHLKNEYTIISGSSNQMNEKMLLIRSNSGYPISQNMKLRKKFTAHEFTTMNAHSRNLVESRFPIAAYKVIADFTNTTAVSTDFSTNHVLKLVDPVNGDKYFKIIQKKEIIGTSEIEFLIAPTVYNSQFSGGSINKQDLLVNVSNSNKSFSAIKVESPDIDVYSGDILSITNSQSSFTQNSDQSVSIRTILQF